MDRPSGDDVTYYYDARGAMTLLKEGASDRAEYLYDDAGARTKQILGNSSYAEYLYNGAGNLTLLSNKESDATVISSFAYLVDDVGNRTKMEIDGSAYTSADVAYLYDDAYQLTSAVRTGGDSYTQTFVYDASDNRTKKTLGGTDTAYLYNTADQLTSETTGGTTTEYLYDANGALTKSDDGTNEKAYTYDYEGYLTAFDTTGTENDATYTYDAGKRRIKRIVDSTTTKYFLDGGNVIADYDGSNTLLATYITLGLDRNLSQTRSGSTYYYMKDGLGSVRNLVDSSEDTQNTYDYYAFGKELGSWSENITNRYTYTAREYDDESEQYYYRARYYNGAGLFTARDPILQPGSGAGLYAYVSNRPISRTDPSGQISPQAEAEFKRLGYLFWRTFVIREPHWQWLMDEWFYETGPVARTFSGSRNVFNRDILHNVGFQKLLACWVRQELNGLPVPRGPHWKIKSNSFFWHYAYNQFAAVGGRAAYTPATHFIGSYTATITSVKRYSRAWHISVNIFNKSGWTSATRLPGFAQAVSGMTSLFTDHARMGARYIPSTGGTMTQNYIFPARTELCPPCDLP